MRTGTGHSAKRGRPTARSQAGLELSAHRHWAKGKKRGRQPPTSWGGGAKGQLQPGEETLTARTPTVPPVMAHWPDLAWIDCPHWTQSPMALAALHSGRPAQDSCALALALWPDPCWIDCPTGHSAPWHWLHCTLAGRLWIQCALALAAPWQALARSAWIDCPSWTGPLA